MSWFALALPGTLIWLGILLLPWQPWRTRERLEPDDRTPAVPTDVTVIVPARNEAAVIGDTLDALAAQGPQLSVIVVDDNSTDETATIARRRGATVISAGPKPDGWAGKLWALEQGRRSAHTRLLLLLDADISLAPGVVGALYDRLTRERLQLVSLMATLRMRSVWEKLLLPAFVFFFRLLYPFRLANDPNSGIAAAAGGCILLDAAVLERIGGFGALRDALIDDCTLAARFKRAGARTWVGLTRGAVSLRAYDDPAEIWNMVARSAYTQLRCSTTALVLCTLALVAAFWLPIAALVGPPAVRGLGLAGLVTMAVVYMPTLRYYDRSLWWSATLPLTGTLYLAMTWTSAWRYWRGEQSRWKGRVYRRA